MRRREFIAGLGCAVAAPAARAQQPAMPVIGLLRFESLETMRDLIAAFHRGLADTGYVEGRNLAIEYRSAEGQSDRLPALAADLVRRQVAVIATPDSTTATVAAQAATRTIPVVFGTGGDPSIWAWSETSQGLTQTLQVLHCSTTRWPQSSSKVCTNWCPWSQPWLYSSIRPTQ
jgi:ABC-type uncharacterized transport system substrate-binding protein